MSSEYMDSEYIPVDLTEMLDSQGNSRLKYDLKRFEAGLADGSYLAGVATALFNAGLEENSVRCLLEDETLVRKMLARDIKHGD